MFKASDYVFCPHCRGSFSFGKPLGNKCCWCGETLPHMRKARNQDALVNELNKLVLQSKRQAALIKSTQKRMNEIWHALLY